MDRSLKIEEILEQAERVRALIRSLVRDRNDAEDVEQRTWMAALSRAPARLTSPAAWIAQVARRMAFQAGRDRKRRSSAESKGARPEAVAATDASVLRLEVHRRLLAAVESLEPMYRSLVVQRWFEGLSPREIAARTGLPVGTISNRLNRALGRLREHLDENGGGRPAWTAALLAILEPGERAALSAGGGLAAAAAMILIAAGAAGFLWQIDPPSRADPSGSPGKEGVSTASLPAAEPAAEDGAALLARRHDGIRAAPGAPDAEPPIVARIAGRVLDPAGAPIAGAAVVLLPGGRRDPVPPDWTEEARRRFAREPALAEGATDAAGAFFLPRPPDGTYRVIVREPGFGLGVREGVTIAAGAPPPDLVFRLSPVPSAACVVTDRHGRPIEGVEIAVRSNDVFTLSLGHSWTDLCQSGPDGTFAVDLLGSDLSDASMALFDRLTAFPVSSRQKLALRRPGFADAVGVHLADRPLDPCGRLRFILRESRRLRLRFLTEGGTPPPRPLEFVVQAGNLDCRSAGTSDTEGVAVLDDFPEGGIARVVVTTPGFVAESDSPEAPGDPRFCGGTFAVTRSGDDELLIPVRAGAAFEGRAVEAESGLPLAGMTVRARPATPWLAAPGHLRQTVSGAGGGFRFEGLPSSWIEIEPRSDLWCAPGDIQRQPWTNIKDLPEGDSTPPPVLAWTRKPELRFLARLTPGDAPSGVEIRMVRRGSVLGAVIDASCRPAPGVRVSLWQAPEDLPRRIRRLGSEAIPETHTGPDGRFVLDGVTPAESIRIVVRAPQHPPALSEPFTLAPGQRQEVPRLALRPGAPLVIRVTGEDGIPVAGHGLRVFAGRELRPQIHPDDFTGATDDRGQIEIRTLPEGPARLAIENATPDGFVLPPAFPSALMIDPARRQEVAVRLIRPRWIRGSVRLSGGTPLAHATVLALPSEVTPGDVAGLRAMFPELARRPDWSPDPERVRLLGAIRTLTGPDGEFVMRADADRPYALFGVVRHGADGREEKIRVRETITLVPGDTRHRITISP